MKKIRLLAPIMTSTMVASSLLTIVSCGDNKQDTNSIVNQVVDTTVSEFKELAVHPRPSRSMKEIQSYLKNWISIHGWIPMEDNAGNIWFDVDPTSGMEDTPKMILQGHMDMEFAYDKAQTVEGTGTKPVPDPKTHAIELVEDTINGRKVIHSKDHFTSIGADDGIGIAMIFAIITNKNVKHGPLRVILTVDEEIGLVGAMNLSKAALDSNYILNFDGEGKEGAEDLICSGCQGMCEYLYRHEFEHASESKLNKTFQIEIKGLNGGHCMSEPYIYFKDGKANVPANADAMALKILDGIKTSGANVQLANYSHYDQYGNEVSYPPKKIPDTATFVFHTSYTQSTSDLKNYINDQIITQSYKDQYPVEDWTKVEINVTDVTSTYTSSSFISSTNTNELIEVFGNKIQTGIEWEGDTPEEKAKLNYPSKTTNVSSFKLVEERGNMLFTIGTRGMSSTIAGLSSIKSSLLDNWKYDKKEITKIKDYNPWDTTSTHKLIDFTNEQYKSFGITPVIEKTRGGVEPAYFAISKPGIEQVVIGPRIDDIHDPKETLYVDTLFNTTKAALLVIENLKNLK